jgi:hypothetical protein
VVRRAAAPPVRDRGSVLLETAIAIPVLLAVAAALAWTLSLVSTTLALQEAARQVARDVARGVDVASAIGSAESSLPGAVLTVERLGGRVMVLARRDVGAPVPLLDGLTVPLRQQVSMPEEWR